METIAWIGFAQGLFVAIIMFTKKEQLISDKVLSAWMTLLSIAFLSFALKYHVFNYSLFSSSFLLFNPALYIYTCSLVQKGFKLKWTMLLHLLPFVIFEILAYVIRTPFTFKNFFELNSDFYFRISFALCNVISWIVYIPLSIILLDRYRKHLQNEKSNIDAGQYLSWLMTVSIFYVVYCIIAIILGIVFVSIGFGENALSLYNYTALLVLIYLISFYGLWQQKVENQTEKNSEKETITYKNSTLSAETKSAIKKRVLDYFENEKAYLNPNLNMDLLSEKISYPKYQITEVLNTEIGKNFFQFVNSYRVEAVKKMLLNTRLKYSIEAIGYECGFSSKSSFYTVFKSLTGETPISFRTKNLS